MSPNAILIIQDGRTKLVNIKQQDTVAKILDMVPDFVNRFSSKSKEKSVTSTESEETVKAAADEMETILESSINKTEE